MYVLVLGLDVLGNPFGLIRGLSEGVEAFFYEPFQVEQKHFLISDCTDVLIAMVLFLLQRNDNMIMLIVAVKNLIYIHIHRLAAILTVLVFNTYTLHYISNSIIYVNVHDDHIISL